VISKEASVEINEMTLKDTLGHGDVAVWENVFNFSIAFNSEQDPRLVSLLRYGELLVKNRSPPLSGADVIR